MGASPASSTQTADHDPFSHWFMAYTRVRPKLDSEKCIHDWPRLVSCCRDLNDATWPLARMARSAGTSFVAMLRLRAELDDAQWREPHHMSTREAIPRIIPLMVEASVEVEMLLLAGTQHGHEKESLTGKKSKMFGALCDINRPATIEEIVMKCKGKTAKVNSDDREAMRELTGTLVDGRIVKANKGGGKTTYELVRVSDDSRR